MFPAADTLRALGEETRLRILRVLLEESLNVGELTRVLGLAQPTVSKHLAELRKAGLVESNRASGYIYYAVAHGLGDWWEAISSSLTRRQDEKGDLIRLQQLLRQRQEISEAPDRFVVPGRSWVAWSRSLRYLLPPLQVADFGCGDGAFTAEIASWARMVYAVDCNPGFLKLAQARAGNSTNIRFLQSDMEAVSLPDQSMDLVVISQSLHYAAEPVRVLQEAHRILNERGRLLLLDLLPHEEKWVLSELNHRWLGFETDTLTGWLQEAGFSDVTLDTDTRQGPDPFRIVIASALKQGVSHFEKRTA